MSTVDARRLLERFLARMDQGELPDFEELVRTHPAQAGELRRLFAEECERLDAGADPASQVLARLTGRREPFARYSVRSEIGQGGMGSVLEVRDEDLRRDLAMKVTSRSVRPGDGADVARFLEEAQITGQLDHPGIVPVHELGLDPEGRVYFTMKLVKGRTLAEVLYTARDGRDGWTQAKVLGAIQRVCEAMAYAHEKGVVHRDLKPANVMIGAFGEVYVMDWGLARVVGAPDRRDVRLRFAEPDQPREAAPRRSSLETDRDELRKASPSSPLLTMDGQVVGTPAYMPPEQAAGRVDEIGPHSDVYSVGAMIYHLLAGDPPYTGSGAREVWLRACAGPPPPIEALAPRAPPELLAICSKAMQRDWRGRYRDMKEMAADLAAFLEGRVVRAYETGAIAEAKKWIRRNRELAASIAAAVALAIGGLAWVSIVQTRASEAMHRKNVELAAATKTAQANESRAVEQEQLATRKAADVLSLSAIQDLKDLETRADALWPADPGKLPEYEAWLADARRLIEGDPGDPSKGSKRRPSLAEHEAKLAEIRLRARPPAPEQIEADRKASPLFAVLEKERARLLWTRRMLGEEAWPDEAGVEAGLAAEELPTDAKSLNVLAWPLVDVDPETAVYGSEVRGLLLARRAVAAASEAQRATYRDTLSWALFRTGKLDEALAEEERAVSEATEEQRKELSGLLERMQGLVAGWRDAARRRAEAEALAARVADLERETGRRTTFEFEDGDDRWWHAQLSKLVLDLQAFADERAGGLFSAGISPEHGWGVPRRAEFARTIEERSVSGAEAAKRWAEAVSAIASSPKYGGLAIEPVVGLLPIGPDPESGLWEFAHLQTGEPAARGADGKLSLEASTGLVFVLIPGGTFRMGAQGADPDAANYSAEARPSESPVHEVALSPYFLSKYEMSQGQWERFTGANPSTNGPARYSELWNRDEKPWTALHPVEGVSWTQCNQAMERLGLSLPSEAQWEHGARGGTETPFWTGADVLSLENAANVGDVFWMGHGAQQGRAFEKDLDDGNSVHAEAGTYRANPFGLHDVLGNVWEWCLDGWDPEFYRTGPRTDPVAVGSGAPAQIVRGGSYNVTAAIARSAFRNHVPAGIKSDDLGLRPARQLRSGGK